MKDEQKPSTINLWPVYYASIFDMSGVMIIGPFIIFYILTFTDDLTVVANVIAVFAIASILGGGFMGAFSDTYGRREALLFCILGTIVTVALMGASVNIPMLMCARALMGLSSNSLSIVNTYITSLVPQEDMMQEIGTWSATLMGVLNICPLLATLLLLSIQQLDLEEQMEYRILFGIGTVFALVGWVYAYMTVPPLYAKQEEDDKKSDADTSEVAFPTTACIVLLLIQVALFLPVFGTMVIAPAWWTNNFNMGAIPFGIFMFVSGCFQAYSNLKVKWLVEKIGGSHQLFIALLIVCGSLHALSGFFHANTTGSFIAHILLLAASQLLSMSNVLVNMWAGLYSPAEHRNKVMASVSSGMWFGYLIAAYAYTGLYTSYNDWAPFVFGGSSCIFAILPVLYLWAHHEEYIASKKIPEKEKVLSPHPSSMHASRFHGISGSCQSTFHECLEWDEKICGKRAPECNDSETAN